MNELDSCVDGGNFREVLQTALVISGVEKNESKEISTKIIYVKLNSRVDRHIFMGMKVESFRG